MAILSGSVSIQQGGNIVAVVEGSATQDESLTQFLTVASALYAYDGADFSRLVAESATDPNLLVALREAGRQLSIAAADGADLPATINALAARALAYGWNGSDWDALLTESDANPNLFVGLREAGRQLSIAAADGADLPATIIALAARSLAYGWNGSDWDALVTESDTNPNLRTGLYEGANQIAQGDTPADGFTQPSNILDTLAMPELYNELTSTWDRQRGNYDFQVFSETARTASEYYSAFLVNYNARGAHYSLNVGAMSGTGPTLKLNLVSNDASNSINWNAECGGVEVASDTWTTPGAGGIMIYPGLTQYVGGTGEVQYNMVLSRNHRWKAALGGTSPNITFSMGALYVL
jgi:hypothetical protein